MFYVSNKSEKGLSIVIFCFHSKMTNIPINHMILDTIKLKAEVHMIIVDEKWYIEYS